MGESPLLLKSYSKSLNLEGSLEEEKSQLVRLSASQNILDRFQAIERTLSEYSERENAFYKTLKGTASKLVIIDSGKGDRSRFYDREEKLIKQVGHNIDLDLPAPYAQNI